MAGHAATTEGQWKNSIYDQVNFSFGDIGIFGLLMRVFTAGFSNVLEAIFGTVDDTYVRDLPIITDHTRTLTEIREIVDQLTLHGNTKVFTSNQVWQPSEGMTSALAIPIGAGGGGGGGYGSVLPGDRRGGGGGQGGGEYHTLPEISGALLPKDGNGKFLPLNVFVGTGGQAGSSNGGSGTGGGSTWISLPSGVLITAQGGDGGSGNAVGGFTGGGGMVPGGRGGDGANRGGSPTTGTTGPATAGGTSVTGYGLYGGGGGGGGGGVNIALGGELAAAAGGVGGAGLGGAVNQPGKGPSDAIPTGGGGGGGSTSTSNPGGAGAIGGGGGGGYGGGTSSAGGKGGNGILFIVERFS